MSLPVHKEGLYNTDAEHRHSCGAVSSILSPAARQDLTVHLQEGLVQGAAHSSLLGRAVACASRASEGWVGCQQRVQPAQAEGRLAVPQNNTGGRRAVRNGA